ncbi:MAG TPA: SAM-dependent chlorinase/fluorinase [Myxococcota bacterium]|nr:SAM-dependent chlorinase/fluorinase [Myxococcota bacterium]HQK50719.1 SAM-dependent chlorinase/fluorinase [Myxococcota bacterium]
MWARSTGVLLGTPGVRVVDLCHLVPAGGIQTGAFLLRRARDAFPVGTVLLGVVDPGVGTNRRPVAIRDSVGFLVGPDNGLLAWAARDDAQWRALSSALRSPCSLGRTFDGRDLFAPVAAGLASGRLAFEDLGPTISDPLRPPFPSWSRQDRTLRGEVIHVDRFGNVLTSIPGDAWTEKTGEGSPLVVRCRGTSHPAVRGVYQQSRGLTVHEDSSGFLEIAWNGNSAAAMLQLGPGDLVEVGE